MNFFKETKREKEAETREKKTKKIKQLFYTRK